MHRKGFLEQLVWIMRKVKITGYQFRWSGGNCLVTRRIISKDVAVWQCRGLVFLHKPFSSWLISYSDLKNIRGVTSCILVSLHRVLQPKPSYSKLWVPSQSFSSFLYRWKLALLSQNKTVKLLSGSKNECVWISWAGDWGILPGANSLRGKNIICKKYNVNSLLLLMVSFFEGKSC